MILMWFLGVLVIVGSGVVQEWVYLGCEWVDDGLVMSGM